MNSGLMLCIEPDWMDTLYTVHFEEFNIFEDLSEQFKTVIHQMLIGIVEESSSRISHPSLFDRYSSV